MFRGWGSTTIVIIGIIMIEAIMVILIVILILVIVIVIMIRVVQQLKASLIKACNSWGTCGPPDRLPSISGFTVDEQCPHDHAC